MRVPRWTVGKVSCLYITPRRVQAMPKSHFSYDAFGNVSKTADGLGLTFLPSYSSTTNQFSLSEVSVSYDADGNLLTDNLNSYTWNPNWAT
jgi:hypothetical protein